MDNCQCDEFICCLPEITLLIFGKICLHSPKKLQNLNNFYDIC